MFTDWAKCGRIFCNGFTRNLLLNLVVTKFMTGKHWQSYRQENSGSQRPRGRYFVQFCKQLNTLYYRQAIPKNDHKVPKWYKMSPMLLSINNRYKNILHVTQNCDEVGTWSPDLSTRGLKWTTNYRCHEHVISSVT